jgi:hypothetical protein
MIFSQGNGAESEGTEMAIGSVSGEGLAEVVRRTSQELGLDHPAARGRAVLAASLVAVAFGGAFAVGAVTKPAATIHAPQLAPGSSATGSQQVSVVAPAAAASIPSLAHKVVKAPVVHHAATKKTATHHARHTTATSTPKHAGTVSTTTHHSVAPVTTTPAVTTPPVTTPPVTTTPAVTTPPVTHVAPKTTTTPTSGGSGTGKSGGSSRTGSGITSGGG